MKVSILGGTGKLGSGLAYAFTGPAMKWSSVVDAGPIEVAAHLERMTVLLLSINKTNKVKESGIKITGI